MLDALRGALHREVFSAAFKKWQKDKAARLGAALAYYTVFSIAPLLIIVIGLAGAVFGQQAAQGQIIQQIQGLVGPESAEFIAEMVAKAGEQQKTGVLATIAGIAVLLFGAAGVFGQLQDALDTIWNAPPTLDRGFLKALRDRWLSFLMVLGVGFLLLVSLVVSAAISAMGEYIAFYIPVPPVALQAINVAVSLAFITVLFAMIFKILPNVEIRWRDVWVGSFISAVLFSLGKYLIGLYLGHSAIASTYGAAGSLVVILVWTYYSAQILLYGAELTQVYSCRRRTVKEGGNEKPAPQCLTATG